MTLHDNDESIETTMMNMQETGITQAEPSWGRVRMVENTEERTTYIVVIEWNQIRKEMEKTE
jgi:hypothetical protein